MNRTTAATLIILTISILLGSGCTSPNTTETNHDSPKVQITNIETQFTNTGTTIEFDYKTNKTLTIMLINPEGELVTSTHAPHGPTHTSLTTHTPLPPGNYTLYVTDTDDQKIMKTTLTIPQKPGIKIEETDDEGNDQPNATVIAYWNSVDAGQYDEARAMVVGNKLFDDSIYGRGDVATDDYAVFGDAGENLTIESVEVNRVIRAAQDNEQLVKVGADEGYLVNYRLNGTLKRPTTWGPIKLDTSDISMASIVVRVNGDWKIIPEF